MSKMIKLVRVKSVAVFSVLSLVAAFLVPSVVGSTAAQAADPELTTFELKAEGTLFVECDSVDPTSFTVTHGSIKAGEGDIWLKTQDGGSNFMPIEFAKAKPSSLSFSWAGGVAQSDLSGAQWSGYSGTSIYGSCAYTFSDLAIQKPPSPTPTGKKPRAPKSVKVAGSPSAKSFKVSWKKPSTKGDRPVDGYRVIIKARGASTNAVNKKLGKKVTSYKVSRKTLLKSLRTLPRGETTVPFLVRVASINNAGQSTYSRSWIRVAS